MPNQSADSREDLPNEDYYGVFIYFFDELKGHIPLYTFPSNLMENEVEKRMLSVHSIWWHQDQFLKSEKFTHIDLEIQNTIYTATLFFCRTKRIKRRSGMDAKKWQYERFILIIKAPASVSFIAQEILQQLKSHLELHMESKLCKLVEDYVEGVISSEQDTLEKNSEKAIRELDELCQSLIPRTPLTKLEPIIDDFRPPILTPSVKRPSRPNKLRFTIPTSSTERKLSEEPASSDIKSIRIIGLTVDETISLELLNTGNVELINIKIKVFQSEGFFGKDIYETETAVWKPNEEKTINFSADLSEGYIYFLKIEDEQETIKLKRILG